MIKSTLLCVLLSTAVYSQYDRNYTVMDNYYKRYCQIEDTSTSVNQKINNPGLYNNSFSMCGIGFLQQLYSNDSEYTYTRPKQNVDFNNLYAWTELKTDIGNFGGYIGNMSLKNNSSDDNLTFKFKDESVYLSAAIWFNPANNRFFKGLSISADGSYSYDRSNNDDQHRSIKSKSEMENIYIKAVSLFQLSDKLHLRWGISGCKYMTQYDNSQIYYNDFINRYYSYKYINYSGSEGKNKQYYGNMNVSFIVNKCFDLTIGTEVNNANQKKIESQKSTFTGVERSLLNQSNYLGSGNILFYLNCALEKSINYRKHKVYLGIDANIKANLIDNKDDYYTTFRDVMKNVKKDQRYVTTNILCPVTMDINLFNLPLFAVVRVVPGLNAYIEHLKSDGQKAESSSCNLNMEQFAFGLKGKIGEKVEFALIPSIQSNIFIGGAEVNYAFGKSKT